MMFELKTHNSKAVISSEGAELKSLVIGGREIMWCADPAFWGKTSPVLFPAIGNVKNNKTVIGGKEVSLSKHGFARDNTFVTVRQSGNSLILAYNYTPIKKSYPYSVQLALQYNLFDDRIEIGYSVYNPGYDRIPFCIGAHPAIACNNLDNCTLVFEKREKASTPVMDLETRLFRSKDRIQRLDGTTKLPLSYEMFDNDVVYFDNIKSRAVKLTEGKKTLASIAFEGFETLGLWTPAGKRAGFICIEPWCGSDDYDDDSGVFEEKKGIQILGGKKIARYKMTISAK